VPGLEQTMRPYALERMSELLTRLAEEVDRAATARDPDSIHDLRVSIRRFGAGLRVSSQYVPPKASKRVRKKLHRMMALAGDVRNRDIALALLRKARIETPVANLAGERELAMRIMASELERWRLEREPARLRAALELPSA